jgi:hypothetical protein
VRAFEDEIRPKTAEIIKARRAGVAPSKDGIQDVGIKAKRASAKEAAGRSRRSRSVASASEGEEKPKRRSKKKEASVARVDEEDEGEHGDREEVSTEVWSLCL